MNKKKFDVKLRDKIIAELKPIDEFFGLSTELTEKDLGLAEDFAKKYTELNAASKAYNEELKIKIGKEYLEKYYKLEADYGKRNRKEILKFLGPEEVYRLTCLIEKVGGAKNLSELDRLKWRGAGLNSPDMPMGMYTRWRIATQKRRPMPSSWNKPKSTSRASGMIGDGPRLPRGEFDVALYRELDKIDRRDILLRNATVEQLDARLKELRAQEGKKEHSFFRNISAKIIEFLENSLEWLEGFKKLI